MSTLMDIQAKARIDIAAQWASAEEAGLPHTAANRDEVIAVIDTFIGGMERLHRANNNSVLDAIRKLYESLDTITAVSDHGLLETDERELLVPIILSCVEAVGLDLNQFPDGEPGGEYRTF